MGAFQKKVEEVVEKEHEELQKIWTPVREWEDQTAEQRKEMKELRLIIIIHCADQKKEVMKLQLSN